MPAAQFVHADAPVVDAYFPPSHTVQNDDPTPEYVPAAQDMQVVADDTVVY